MVNCRWAESWELEPGGRNRDPGEPAKLGVVCRVSGLGMLTSKITYFLAALGLWGARAPRCGGFSQEHRLRGQQAPVVVTHVLSCPQACGIF